jgi:hypothetical protein
MPYFDMIRDTDVQGKMDHAEGEAAHDAAVAQQIFGRASLRDGPDWGDAYPDPDKDVPEQLFAAYAGALEKVLGARRAGVMTVIMPKRNGKDLEDVPEAVRSEMTFIFVETIDEVLNNALEPTATPQLRAAAGSAFRAPSTGELYYPFSGNPALQPERTSPSTTPRCWLTSTPASGRVPSTSSARSRA